MQCVATAVIAAAAAKEMNRRPVDGSVTQSHTQTSKKKQEGREEDEHEDEDEEEEAEAEAEAGTELRSPVAHKGPADIWHTATTHSD